MDQKDALYSESLKPLHIMHKKIAAETYRVFSSQQGNEHIASENALAGVIKYIKYRKAESVLEIGSGIGSIADAISRAMNTGFLDGDSMYYGTEVNEFCTQKFKENITHKNFFLFRGFAGIPRDKTFDFVIIDGKDTALDMVLGRLRDHGIVFIEGRRKSQLKLVIAGTKRKCLVINEISLQRRSYGPFRDRLDHLGGFRACIFDPRPVDYIIFVIRKVITACKFRIFQFKKMMSGR